MTSRREQPPASTASPRIMLVDDDRIILDSLAEFLRLEGYVVDTASDVPSAIKSVSRQSSQLVITDVNMPRGDGFELLRTLRQHHPESVVIVMTGYGTIESAVEAIRMGAYDYLTKPIVDDEIRLVVQRALQQQSLLRENRSLKEQLGRKYSLDNIIAADHKMLKAFELIEAVADTRTTVLISGESGTGKSLIARAMHFRSSRCGKPFVEVSCGALPETLLESELFGHVRGSFTGAVSDKPGKFRAAEGGTIFLDEISSASPALQVKLLRVLQEKQFEPIGSNETQTVDVRVILASNRDLAEEVKANRFRQDLYYRINVVTIGLSPLRDRLSDVPLLADYFLEKYREQHHKEVIAIAPEAMAALQRYTWPGNVRELENAVERAVVLTRHRTITPADLPQTVLDEAAAMTESPDASLPLKKALELPEKRIIEAALRTHHWNRQTTAEALQINRTTLYKKMKRYGLETEAAMR